MKKNAFLRSGTQRLFRGGIAPSVLTVALGLILPLHARQGCTNQDFIGVFGFFGAGNVVHSPGLTPVGPFARVGTFVTDGNGHLRFNSTANFDGFIAPFDFLGTYAMAPDCTFNAVLHLTNPFKLDVNFIGVLADDGNESRELFIEPPGIVIFANGRKQNLHECTQSAFFGSFLLEMSGSTPAGTIRLPFAALGQIDVDGGGNVVGKLRSNFGGLSTGDESISGTYTMAKDCTFRLKYYTAGEGRGPNDGVTLKGVLIDQGKGAFLMVLDPPSAVVVGSLKRQ